MPHLIILGKVDAFRNKLNEAHDWLHDSANVSNANFTAVENWIADVQADWEDGRFDYDSRMGEIKNLLP